jgi:hypothetical protein
MMAQRAVPDIVYICSRIFDECTTTYSLRESLMGLHYYNNMADGRRFKR